MERLIGVGAREIGMDRAELRPAAIPGAIPHGQSHETVYKMLLSHWRGLVTGFQLI